MKGDIILEALKKIKNTAVSFSDLFEAMLKAGYGASLRSLNYEVSKIEQRRNNEVFQRQIRLRYYRLIYKLKKDQLIRESFKNNHKFLNITRRGLSLLGFLQKRKDKNPLPSPNRYVKDEDQKTHRLVIVVFDVPEREKNKRNWLRAVLKRLGLEMIQKSVWAGTVKLPEQFINDLIKFKIIDFVEILEVTKKGSLEQIR